MQPNFYDEIWMPTLTERKDFAAKLAAFRDKNGWSDGELAAWLEYPLDTTQAFLKAELMPAIELLRIILEEMDEST